MLARLERLEAVQAMVLEISQVSADSRDLHEFLTVVHRSISRIVYAANFFVALYNPEKNSIRYTYYIDENDAPPNPELDVELKSADQSPTAWIIANKKALVMTAAEDAQREQEVLAAGGLAWGFGARAEHWMGYPLLDNHGQVLGAVVIQSYDAAKLYSEEDQALFGMIAKHIASALQGQQSMDRLEQAVRERTMRLEQQINERRRAETLQRVLYEIAELSASTSQAEIQFARLHKIISQLLQVPNFMVALFYPEVDEFCIQYVIDEIDQGLTGKRFPMGAGMTSFVARRRQAELIDQARMKDLCAKGELKVLGNTSAISWMGAPLLMGEQIFGVIIIQSYDTNIVYTQADLELLAFVAHHVTVALARIKTDQEIRLAYARLEQQNETLNQTLVALKQAQNELISQEKLASLGRLVAGVAHEINTPVGICVTATSHLVEELAIVRKEMEAERLDEAGLMQFFDTMDQTLRILTTNCQRSAALIRSFKQVAVDQSSENIREFDLSKYLDEILISLQPKFKGKKVKIKVDCPEGTAVKTFPGAISQIITNMLMNSLLHGLEGREQLQILIQVRVQGEAIQLDYQDDGAGMEAGALLKLFEPFYTTKRAQGGSGLGAHIIYNLATNVLQGTLKAQSEPGQGLQYQLRFPRRYHQARQLNQTHN